MKAPQGAAKTSTRVVALFAKGYGHCLQRAPRAMEGPNAENAGAIFSEG
jgi:hypothetical protein